MNKLVLMIKSVILIGLFSTFSYTATVSAEEETGLCPDGYAEGQVTTGFVDCHRESGSFNDIEDAELARLQREAVCNATPNAEIIYSEVEVNSSGRFFARLVCRVNRPVPPGTKLCPDDSQEVFRAFDTLVCQYFGNVVATVQEGNAALTAQSTECTNVVGGRVLESSIRQDEFDEIPFFFTSLACGVQIPATDIFDCPWTFHENSRDEDLLECEFSDDSFMTLAEAQNSNAATQLICTDTTAGLGTVTESLVGEGSPGEFFNTVVCEIRLPRYGPFSDDSILRACDASCTEQVSQSRMCLNGGQAGGPGCTEPATQVIDRRCNTGVDRDGLCPLIHEPATIYAPLLLEEDVP